MTVLFTIASLAVGFVLGVEWYDHAVHSRVAVHEKILFG
jgi:hypothetical protein